MRIRIKFTLILNFAIGLSVLAASLTGGQQLETVANDQVVVLNESVTDNSVKTEKENSQKNRSVKEIVTEEFSDIPVMIDVASCESEFRQFDSDGSLLRGISNPLDVGVFQINEKYHLKDSRKLGMDIYTLEGNMKYARHLYKTQGTRPWEYSSKCWSKTREVALAN